jgi:multiple sugar transport system permease protein
MTVRALAGSPAELAAARAPSHWHLFWRRNGAGYFFMTPWLLGFFGLTIGPAVISLYLSFTNFNLLQAPSWIGDANYVQALTHDPTFMQSLRVTFFYVVVSVPLKLAFALAVAMLLNRGLKGLSLYRAIFYLPSLLGASVAISVLWRELFEGDGIINQLLGHIGITGPSWISNPRYALWTIILLSIWQFGSPMIIFLAGLRQIPQDVHEAASIDGASKARRFWSITLPLLTPVVFFNAIIQGIDAFKSFTPAFIISGGTGAPINSTLFYTLYLYQEAFSYFRMGYAAAMAWILLIIIAVFTGISFLTSRYWVYYDE